MNILYAAAAVIALLILIYALKRISERKSDSRSWVVMPGFLTVSTVVFGVCTVASAVGLCVNGSVDVFKLILIFAGVTFIVSAMAANSISIEYYKDHFSYKSSLANEKNTAMTI